MAERGRPRKVIDWKEFDKLCQIQCTLEEIAGFFECDVSTIHHACYREWGMNFTQYSEMKRSSGKIALRNQQLQQAKKGNTSLLIWLGKQYLGQSDNPLPTPASQGGINPIAEAMKQTAAEDCAELEEDPDVPPLPG